MECIVQIGCGSLVTILQLASSVQLFLLIAESFSLAFLFSSVSTYQFLDIRHITFVRHGCQMEPSKAQEQGESICSEAASHCPKEIFYTIFS